MNKIKYFMLAMMAFVAYAGYDGIRCQRNVHRL